MDYLDRPSRASASELPSLNIFTHESMHIRGERDEAVPECQAVQRNGRAAVLLGVPFAVASRSANSHFDEIYLKRASSGPFSAAYFSTECAPGRALDEHLSEPVWLADQGAGSQR